MNYAPNAAPSYVSFTADTRRALNRLKMALRGKHESDVMPDFVFKDGMAELHALHIADHTETGPTTVWKISKLLGTEPDTKIRVTPQQLFERITAGVSGHAL